VIFIGGGGGPAVFAVLLLFLLLVGANSRGGALLVVLLLMLLPVALFVLVPIMMFRGATRVLTPQPTQVRYPRYPPPPPSAPDPRGWDQGSVPTGPPVVRADVVSLRDRLAHDVRSLDPGDDPVARQALADASERLQFCTGLLDRARSEGQLRTAWHAAGEGLMAARVVRERLGLDPGPVPPLPSGGAPQLDQRARVRVGGTEHVGSPTYEPGRSHHFPGGYYDGRPVPGGWYAVPFWETALLAGAAGMLFGGLAGAASDGWDGGSDVGGGWGSGDVGGGGWGGGDLGGGWGGGDLGGGFGGGDFGGGDFGGW
jgi:hypothetical protein